MEPLHVIEYELTSELAAEIRRHVACSERRRSWRRDGPLFLGSLLFAILIAWPVFTGWMLPTVGGGLLLLVALPVVGALWRRASLPHTAGSIALLALYTSDRRVRIEFHEKCVRMDTEFFRGEGAWTELDEIVVFPGFWVLYLTNGGQIVLPGMILPELESFLRSKAEEVGAPLITG
jgi:hypothetical protein